VFVLKSTNVIPCCFRKFLLFDDTDFDVTSGK
jgi:hypothetical protein